MPKMKSFKAAKKRFRKTASGKLTRGKAYHRHLLTGKARGRKRAQRVGGDVSPAGKRRVQRMLPYL